MKKISIILLGMIFIFCSFSIFTVVHADNSTDFSNAQYEVTFEKGGELNIIGVTPNAGKEYYYTITSNNTKPEFNSTSKDWGILKLGTSGLKNDGTNTTFMLNQDLYIWIVEKTSGKEDAEFVVEGKKLERTGYPKDYNLFVSSFISEGITQIILNDIGYHYTVPRTLKLRIGKIGDTSILNKLKNNTSVGFNDLLSYSKTASAIYENNNLELKEKKCTTNISMNPENGNYYYIYATLDDENGKYYPVEGVTIGQASVIGKNWSLFLYGTNDFKWSGTNSGESETTPETISPKTDPDETVATTILPKTGISTTIIIITMIGVGFIASVLDRKYKRWKDIK